MYIYVYIKLFFIYLRYPYKYMYINVGGTSATSAVTSTFAPSAKPTNAPTVKSSSSQTTSNKILTSFVIGFLMYRNI
jgi:hypothetical protein